MVLGGFTPGTPVSTPFFEQKKSPKRDHIDPKERMRENEKEKRFLNILNFNPSEYKLPSFQI